jgi:uncharacterized protein YbaP (TraB family)
MVRGGKRLVDVMPADLYARFALQRSKLTDDPKKWERYRPIIASAFLQQAAFHQVGLSARLDLGAAMRILAKKHHVRLDEVKMAAVGDMMDMLKTLDPATENTCVEASLVTVERGLPRLIERAQAWADGNVERLENLPEPPEVDACLAALESGTGAGDLFAQMRHTWLDAMQKSLRNDSVTVAVVNLDMVLAHGGLLDELRALGYTVDPP